MNSPSKAARRKKDKTQAAWGNNYAVVVVGPGGVGKSALTMQFVQNRFIEKYDPTIEDLFTKAVELDGEAITIDVIDTAGQEAFAALRDQYLKEGDGFLVVYDISNELSFRALQKLTSTMVRIRDFPVPVLLVGNKSDLSASREISYDEAEAQSKEWGFVGYRETSAKNNENVHESFITLAREIREWRKANPERAPAIRKKKEK
eukprot:CAMPEP_0174267362 /NCGR_PEP_ID=MMETSP0439-20130205/33364_1 /TAXON_ID=0 /ORGANISM="Stereomyxa ramosa, Strain Chinc5" /LENGTH=203 /DNA_ID=CAMNT_0015354813 /DNA_START=63 /DNA_END=671 /DNA_ORIENTATION=+